jgi:ketosteroid isomerase-like protein
MTITIQIKPEIQAELAAQAAARGMDMAAYAATLLEEAVHVPFAGPKRLSREQVEKLLDEMAQFSHKIPSLPDEALSRESLYQDHD